MIKNRVIKLCGMSFKYGDHLLMTLTLFWCSCFISQTEEMDLL